jgi:hypothetical protein
MTNDSISQGYEVQGGVMNITTQNQEPVVGIRCEMRGKHVQESRLGLAVFLAIPAIPQVIINFSEVPDLSKDGRSGLELPFRKERDANAEHIQITMLFRSA